MNFFLSLIVPCFNPKENWLSQIVSETQFLKEKSIPFELIIINDGSTKNISENTNNQLKELKNCIFISYEKNKGKGYALRKGVEAAKGELIIYTDVDFPYTHESFIKVLENLKKGADVVVGIRPSSYYDAVPLSRKFISKVLRFLIRKLLNIPTNDTQCGLKGFNRKGREVFLKTTINRYLFDMEFIKLATKEKLSIQLCEVHLKPNLEMPAMPVKILLQESFNFLRIMFS